MALALFPILLLVVSIFIYFVSARADVREVAKAAFWAGFFGLAFAYANHMVHIG